MLQQQVVKVNGENGARAFQLAPNGSALLLDESGAIVWLITSDGAGYKTLTPYDITPHKIAPSPDYTTLESRISRLEETINEYARNTSATTGEIVKPVSTDYSTDKSSKTDAWSDAKPTDGNKSDSKAESSSTADYQPVRGRGWRN